MGDRCRQWTGIDARAGDGYDSPGNRKYFGSVKAFLHNVREDRTEVVSDNKENEDDIDDKQWVRYITDLQAAYTTYIAEMAYGRIMT
ncbi:helicase [Penicillium daleae]|uniref:Helicase n=1 Tax=Penicillium daleae TaxID=63821 RepID=A0AAD6CAS1_9EURO|nr:helicase [Penicillium daleae]KAJ5456034.1 helicase [Penicillium daleae]